MMNELNSTEMNSTQANPTTDFHLFVSANDILTQTGASGAKIKSTARWCLKIFENFRLHARLDKFEEFANDALRKN